MTTNLQQLTRNPDAIAQRIAEHLRTQSSDGDGELVYTPTSGHSYYRDLHFRDQGGAQGRLDRHAKQMRHVTKERQERALRLQRSGAFEFRVEPNRTDGQGGYFSPPAWPNQLFATANRPGRVLADLMPSFPLPAGVSSVSLPIIGAGSTVATAPDNAPAPSQDITDSPGSSSVTPLSGFVDVSLQLLEQSPAGAHLDWAIFMDLSEATDADLEAQLISGTGTGAQLLGITNVVSGTNAVTFTNASPTGALMYPFLGQVFAQISNNRLRHPQCWLMRGARWAWLKTSEGSDGLPFDIGGTSYLGSTDDTPDPIGGLIGLPVFLDEAITATQGTGGNQDVVIALRPSDLILLEGIRRRWSRGSPCRVRLGLGSRCTPTPRP